MKIRIALIVLGFASLFVSCRKDREYNQGTDSPKVMEELQVPSGFDWKTTKDYSLTLSSPVAGLAEVTNNSGLSFQKAYLSAGQPYTMKLTLPAYEQSVRVRMGNTSSSIELSATELQFNF